MPNTEADGPRDANDWDTLFHEFMTYARSGPFNRMTNDEYSAVESFVEFAKARQTVSTHEETDEH